MARDILDAEDLTLSARVLQEFYVQSTRSSRPDPLTHEQALNLIEAWLRYPVQSLTVEVLRSALATCLRWNISYWDVAIVEAARAAGCPVLLSEDLQPGMDFAGIRVRNPFSPS